MKNTTTINFRNKFDKLIRNDAERQLFVSAFEKFLGFNHEDALRLLWELTCGPSEWTLYKLGLSTENVSPSMENALGMSSGLSTKKVIPLFWTSLFLMIAKRLSQN